MIERPSDWKLFKQLAKLSLAQGCFSYEFSSSDKILLAKGERQVCFCILDYITLTVTGKFLVMIGTLLYVFGSRDRHSKQQRGVHPIENKVPKGGTFCCHLYKLGS